MKRRTLVAAAALWLPFTAASQLPTFELTIRDHLFYPAEMVVPAEQKFRLLIHNLDDTPEEFESHQLNREKVINARQTGQLLIGPLSPGEYPFIGEFNPHTAQGILIVK